MDGRTERAAARALEHARRRPRRQGGAAGAGRGDLREGGKRKREPFHGDATSRDALVDAFAVYDRTLAVSSKRLIEIQRLATIGKASQADIEERQALVASLHTVDTSLDQKLPEAQQPHRRNGGVRTCRPKLQDDVDELRREAGLPPAQESKARRAPTRFVARLYGHARRGYGPTMLEIDNLLIERLLLDASVREGMHVLDVGCGHGAVTRLLGRLVGPGGRVVGVDRDGVVLSRARALADEQGCRNLTFVHADIDTLPPELGPFDAIVGRRVLMYQPDAVACVRGLSAALRPGGRMVFQEHDATMVPAASAALPLHRRVHDWIWATVAHEGADLRMGLELAGVLACAGLTLGHVRAQAIVQTATQRSDTASIVRHILPRLLAAGVAREDEIDVDTLDRRLADELAQDHATWVGDMVFGAWATRPT